MLETIVVMALVGIAAAYAIYRLFRSPSCGCGSNCACTAPKSFGDLADKKNPTKSSRGSNCQCKK